LELCKGVHTPGTSAIEPRVLLTPREQEVATLAAKGMSNREISGALDVSVRTIENQLQRTYEKLGVASRSELADVISTEI
jgi:DNA-binding NarL/FixJ family response regulator